MNAETPPNKSSRTFVFYDGLCHLCSREINHYKKMRGSENIDFVDITNPTFHAESLGLDPIQVHHSLHAIDKLGNLHTGVDAFICIWSELSALQFLVSITSTAPIRLILKCFYAVFAKVRPYLPRKSCESSPYCETNPK